MSESAIPSSRDVVQYLNERLEARGFTQRIDHIAVLPYINPMWMANWEAPQLQAFGDPKIIDEELREARWRFPQVTQDF